MANSINAKVYSKFSPGETVFVIEGNQIKSGIIREVEMTAISQLDGSLKNRTTYYLDSTDPDKQISRISRWKENEIFESREELIETL